MNGFGGDLRFGKTNGLDGADEICRQIAETSMAGNGKTWRAFLSVTRGPERHARQRDRSRGRRSLVRPSRSAADHEQGRSFANAAAGSRSDHPRTICPTRTACSTTTPMARASSTTTISHRQHHGRRPRGHEPGRHLSGLDELGVGGRSPRCGVTWPRASLVQLDLRAQRRRLRARRDASGRRSGNGGHRRCARRLRRLLLLCVDAMTARALSVWLAVSMLACSSKERRRRAAPRAREAPVPAVPPVRAAPARSKGRSPSACGLPHLRR